MEGQKYVFCVDRRKAQEICDLIGNDWQPRSLAQPLTGLCIKSALVFDLRVFRYERGVVMSEQWVEALRMRMAKDCEGLVFIQ